MTSESVLVSVSFASDGLDQRHTAWFATAQGQFPSRVGVYEGTACGIPGMTDNSFEHRYYHWDGQRFSRAGRTPGEAAAAADEKSYLVAHWRGLLVEPAPLEAAADPRSYTGTATLVTTHSFGLRIEHLTVNGKKARFRFTTQESDRCTMEGEARLNWSGWYVSPTLPITFERSTRQVVGLVAFRVEQHDRRCYVFGVWKEEELEDRSFSGELMQTP